MIVLPDVENRTIVSSFVWTKHWNVTEGQTDRQTDRIPLASTPVCIASNADALKKNRHALKNEKQLESVESGRWRIVEHYGGQD